MQRHVDHQKSLAMRSPFFMTSLLVLATPCTVKVVIRQKNIKVSAIKQFFSEIYDLALVPGHLSWWLWHDFDSSFKVFWAVSGVCFRAENAKVLQLLFLELKVL